MDTYLVTEVREYRPDSKTPCWMLVMTRPDGETHLHVMPKHTIDCRMAEYDVDAETALDMALHEPFAARLRPHGEVPVLFTAPTVTEARDAHMALLQRAKDEVVQVVSRPAGVKAKAVPDPLDVIRRAPRAPAEAMEAVREAVLAERARYRNHAVKEASRA